MFRKNSIAFLSAVILFLTVGSLAVFAQVAPVRGRVELKKADGTTAPVAGALVEVFRTDIKSKLPSDKTDKKGGFSFAGLPLGATFVLSVSAPGVSPNYLPNVRAGADNLLITVNEGDGKRWTEEEIRSALTAPAAAAAAGGETTQKAPQLTAEQKKAQAEYEKKVAEVAAKNDKIKNNDAVIQKSFSEGNAAYKAKNYDLAISKFDEGINAEPDFAGSAPVLLNIKGAALKDKGFESYSQGAKSADAAIKASMFEAAKKDWNASMEAYDRALVILKGATAPDPAEQKKYDTTKLNVLQNLIEVHRLMNKSGVDRSKSAQAKIAYDQYLAIETDAAAKAKAELNLADILRESGDFEGAVAGYKKALENSPDNPDALAGAGLSLFALGASVQPENLAQEQEGLNYLQRFTEVAPENHPLKASVKESVDYLKSKSLTPQKTSRPAAGKRKT